MTDERVVGWKDSCRIRTSEHNNDHKFSLNWKDGREGRNLDQGKRKRSPSDSDNRKEKHSSKKKIKKKKEKKAKREKRKKKKKSQIVDTPSPRNVITTESAVQPRNFTPMTKEEWDKQQSVVRRVYDPETGRNRLVKGTGEILEEIVSKQQHQKINKVEQATLGDGFHYQATLMNKLRKN